MHIKLNYLFIAKHLCPAIAITKLTSDKPRQRMLSTKKNAKKSLILFHLLEGLTDVCL